jgi:hypothetical protein
MRDALQLGEFLLTVIRIGEVNSKHRVGGVWVRRARQAQGPPIT